MAVKEEKMIKKVKFPIALKLVLLNTTLAVFALGILTTLATYFIRQDVQLTAEQSNHAINSQAADTAEYELTSIRDNVALFVSSLSVLGFDDENLSSFGNLLFEGNPNIAVVAVPGIVELLNTQFFEINGVLSETYYSFLSMLTPSIERAINGELIVVNATAAFGVPSVALLNPWRGSVIVTIFSVENLVETFGSGTTNTSFMINDSNDILVHSDFDLVYSAANLSHISLVDQMRKNNDENRQIIFADSAGVEFFGAYTKLPLGDIAIVTTIESSLVFEGVDTTLYQNSLLAVAILFLLIMFIRLFSNSITKPVTILTEASEQIERGNFSLDLKPNSHDEIGLLTSRFISMSKGLETFGRFVNLDIAKKAMQGDLELGGETKNVTVFFSDIRSFTEISEKLEPAEVIEFLNDYMSRMVECVRKTNGSVDKYIGDAVMAVWGASATTGDIAADALNGVRASLMMRAALKEFNVGRGSEKEPIITIGCGLNSGAVVAGQMGSKSHMEYTVIGDAVNLASRTEMLTKLFCTDILITEGTYKLVKDYVLVEKMPSVSVKGKEKPVSIYAVINMPKETAIPGVGLLGPKTLQELREELGFPTPDLTNIDVNVEERKYKVE